jgi:hypothetical protein
VRLLKREESDKRGKREEGREEEKTVTNVQRREDNN